MPRILVDFNALTEDDAVRLTAPFIADQIRRLGLKAGDRVILTDGEISAVATIHARAVWELVAVTDRRS